MTEHPRVRLARLFNLKLAYDRRGLFRPQFLAPGMQPSIDGPWTVYGFRQDVDERPDSHLNEPSEE